VVQGVFGLDTRSIGKPAIRVVDDPTAPAAVLTPQQVAKTYNFPETDAAGQTVGLLEFEGGYFPADIGAYFRDSIPDITEYP
jgi:kumamolisin